MRKIVAGAVVALTLLTGVGAAGAWQDPYGGGSTTNPYGCKSSTWHSGQRAYLVIRNNGTYFFSAFDRC